MDKEQILALGLQVFDEHPYDEGHVVSPTGYTWIDDQLIEFASKLLESYKADLLKGSGKPVLYAEFAEDGEWLGDVSEYANHLEKPHALFTSDQLAAAVLKATGALDKPIDTALAAEIERTDWTPAEALQFYADQRNFDIVGGHARIIDNGAVASNALKHLSIDRLELKGDAELAELRAQLAAAQDQVAAMEERLERQRSYFDAHQNILMDEIETAEQRVAEACALQVATETKFHWLDAARVAKEIRSGEWRKFVKEA